MKTYMIRRFTSGIRAILLPWCMVLWFGLSHEASAQRIPGQNFPDGLPPGVNLPSSPRPDSSGSASKETGPWLPSEPPPTSVTTNLDGTITTNSPEEIQLSFQGANVDMIVQWL